jgi:hypothetical protein
MFSLSLIGRLMIRFKRLSSHLVIAILGALI